MIFYHGENHANPEKAALYCRLFPALVADWRRAWGRPDLPFLCFLDGKSSGFEVAGADGVYHVATSEIHDDTLVVSSPEVATPVAIRYAWRDTPEVSLYNAATLPASPFRAAHWAM